MAEKDSGPLESAPDQSVAIGYFRPEDAPGITALFRAVYGEDYPVKLFYDPEALRQANENGDYYSLVARRVSGGVVGVLHLFRSAPHPHLYELGAGLVCREYRNLGIQQRLLGFAFEDWVPRQQGIEGVFGEAVCNHPFMQKAMVFHQYPPTALEIALMPAEAFDREKSAGGRVAVLVGARSYRPITNRIFLPGVYASFLQRIYSQSNARREFLPAEDGPNLPGDSNLSSDFFDFAQVARISVRQAASDLVEQIAVLEGEARGKGGLVIQVWLNLGDPQVGCAVDRLRTRGYFFGGLFPLWFGSDGLLLQKLFCPPDFEGITMVLDEGQALLEFIRRDYDQVRTE